MSSVCFLIGRRSDRPVGRGLGPVKLLLDMGISPGTGFYLEKLGHHAVHLIDEGMDSATDGQIMEKALKESS